jgi:ABC-type ATPase involved in cell division
LAKSTGNFYSSSQNGDLVHHHDGTNKPLFERNEHSQSKGIVTIDDHLIYAINNTDDGSSFLEVYNQNSDKVKRIDLPSIGQVSVIEKNSNSPYILVGGENGVVILKGLDIIYNI